MSVDSKLPHIWHWHTSYLFSWETLERLFDSHLAPFSVGVGWLLLEDLQKLAIELMGSAHSTLRRLVRKGAKSQFARLSHLLTFQPANILCDSVQLCKLQVQLLATQSDRL